MATKVCKNNTPYALEKQTGADFCVTQTVESWSLLMTAVSGDYADLSLNLSLFGLSSKISPAVTDEVHHIDITFST